mgnify:FL=1
MLRKTKFKKDKKKKSKILSIKNKKKEDKEVSEKDNDSVLEKGARNIKDLIAPPSFDRSNPDCIKVGNKYVRSFMVNGYPSNISVGWLDNLYSYDGDIDTALYIEPADERGALEELTKKITQFKAQLSNEIEKGNIKNTTRLRNDIMDLYAQREKLEKNYENLFYIQTFANLYTDSMEELKKQSQMLDNKMKGRRISLNPLYLKQDDAYKSALPFGKVYTNEAYRNFDSGALTACFPFYNSEISHDNGVFIGINLETATPVLIDFYDRKILENSNFTVFGKSGSGKTFFLLILTLRSILKGIRTVIIDPEGEYLDITKAVGGTHVYIAENSETKINPFDLEEEDETDDLGRPTGLKVVKIKEKVADLLNLIGVMAGGLTREQESLVSTIIAETYRIKGFTEDPKSLYVKEAVFNEETKEFYHDGKKKAMPTLSDFHKLLVSYAEKEDNEELKSLANSLKMFVGDGVYNMFDCQTSKDIDFKNSPIVTFDISQLEDSVLRPIGMYIALSWTWEKFIKKNPLIKKRIICEEAWMLVNRNMAGHEYTATFIEKAARRIRKRNGGLLIASQNFVEFDNSEQGKAVLTNAVLNIFFKQDATDIEAVQNTFRLSDGEKRFLLSAKIGQMLVKMGEESTVAYAMPFSYEKDLIDKNKK